MKVKGGLMVSQGVLSYRKYCPESRRPVWDSQRLTKLAALCYRIAKAKMGRSRSN
jgi:hypothetical protein